MAEQCPIDPAGLVVLLSDGATAEESEAAELRGHVRNCGACREELDALWADWDDLPASAATPPPVRLRRRLLEEAREAVASPAVQLARMWAGLRPVAWSLALGAAGAGLFVLGLGLRGHLTVTDPVAAAWLAVLLAAGLGVVGFGLVEEGAGSRLRGLLAASLATFVGYAGLNLLHPVPEAVDFCRVSVLGASELSTGSLCLVYLGVAALYAGAPAGLAAWRWDGRRPARGMGLTVAAVVTVLAVPFHGLQLGAANLAVVASTLLGLGLGSLTGASAGSLVRHRVGALLSG